MCNTDEVIDLTSSFSLVNHCHILPDEIITVDSDESFEVSRSRKKPSKRNKSQKRSENKIQESSLCTLGRSERESRFQDCPICLEELGTSPLASTRCGHVFCLKCLEQSLQVEKKCPTCRRSLRANNSFHPLYLGRG